MLKLVKLGCAARSLGLLLLLAAARPGFGQSDKQWNLDKLLSPPTQTESVAVEQEWQTRRLFPSDMRQERIGELEMDHATFDVRILSHRVQGSRHFGVVFVPQNGRAQKLAAINLFSQTNGPATHRWYPVHF